MKVNSILETIGSTPHVRMNRLFGDSEVWIKSERSNPGGSITDRIALRMIEEAEESGALKPGGTIVEPTSGNTGIGLAMVAAVKGYRLILTMPESMSLERRKLLTYLGAELVLTEAAKGMNGAIARANELVEATPGAVMPSQFSNPANPDIHRKTTAIEIWNDTKGQVDVFIAGVGTGGTLTGVASILKAKKPGLHVVAVEPADSPVISGGKPGPHKIQGIGAGFIPDNLDVSLIDATIQVSNDQAFAMAREAARLEGVPGGISSGAALTAALEIARRDDMAGKTIVVILASSAERYLSTALFEE
jgi:cysteine synthase A